MSDSPITSSPEIDVVAEVLEAIRMTPHLFGRIELGRPWRLEIPSRPYLSFYVVVSGSGWIEVEGGEQTPIPLSIGDAIVLPRGSAHRLYDADRSDISPQQFDFDGCPRIAKGRALHLGGDGPATMLVVGRFEPSMSMQNALLDVLPPAIHLPVASLAAVPQLAGVTAMIVGESMQPGIGSPIVMGRLADILLVQAFRLFASRSTHRECGLHALNDPSIGSALQLMHARPAEAWTVESLARAVGMSRSSFASRFRQLVGESPLQYLAQWRMTRAAQMLREGEESMADIAESIGYANPVAFTKAFARMQGIAPGAYRRAQRVGASERAQS